jgi:nucleotide-binding universal stress UspA family protein
VADGHIAAVRAERGDELEVTPDTEPAIEVAIDAGQGAARVADAAGEFARLFSCPVDVVHVVESEVVGDQTAERESPEIASRAVTTSLARLEAAGVTGRGQLLPVVGTHTDTGRRIAEFAKEHQARMIVVGAPTEGEWGGLLNVDVTGQLLRHARCDVHVVPTGAEHGRERATLTD